MYWGVKMWIFFLVSLAFSPAKANKRHVIYWDAELSNEYLNVKTGRVLNVQIGQFMDILCPQTSLMDLNDELKQPLMFDLFNVTKPNYDNCSHEGRKNFIFSCNKPERENKLTIKFQLISPSPLGFRFQYCKDYYFVAVPRDKNKWGDGCHRDSATRLHIKVGCRRGAHHHTTTKRTPLDSRGPKVPPKPVHPGPDLDTEEELIIHPSIIPRLTSGLTTSKSKDSGVKPNLLAQTGNKGKNSGPNLRPTTLLMLVTTLLYIILTSLT